MTVAAAPVGPQRYAETYPATEVSATRARHDTSLILLTWHLDPMIEAAELIVTELMANAVRHGEGPISFSVTRLTGGVKISVCDRCAKKPNRCPADLSDEGGRGLFLVETLATSWGCEVTRSGKKVWAELLSGART
ncbi:ATP-binding protein [Streptomyces sp. 5-10]|uniref:ATP-binding protein n=1 Tax=Streptomyces sp. 5-10 TaxID=878925 RepID=UPI00168B44D4|nr:ATP-binding protein [Streptomyces sp. 5-10]MBD3004533.1 ATP-binding protein [Streptomyces sp. 5-10]